MARIVYVGEGCTGCKTCSVACAYAHDRAFSLKAGRIWVVKEEPATDIPITCYQCVRPPCKDVCPVGAISRVDDLVLVNEGACIGCGACVEACPFGAIILHPVRGVAIKCDLCGGKEPECIRVCPAAVLKLQAPALVAQERRPKR